MNMSLLDLQNYIESVEYDAKMSVFSGFNSFLSAVQEEPIIHHLITILSEDDSARQAVFQHFLYLLPLNSDLGYAHPYDIALSSYLYALEQTDTALASEAAKAVVQRKDLSWSRRLAQTIQENHKVNSGPVE